MYELFLVIFALDGNFKPVSFSKQVLALYLSSDYIRLMICLRPYLNKHILRQF